MKKKVVALLIAVMVFSLCACGTTADDTTISDNDVDNTVVEDDTTEDAVVEDDTTVPGGTDSEVLTFSNVTYSLGNAFSYYGDQSGTLIYQSTDTTESIAFYVQNETSYTEADLRGAYATQIVATYGDNYTQTTVDVNGLTWDCYSYGSDNILSSSICADLYVYSDGATTIYVENDYSSSKAEASGDVMLILNSIVIE